MIAEAVDDFVEFIPNAHGEVDQTLVKTNTGIWRVTYNAENRPVRFESEGSNLVVECAYDYMGRRASKKVTSNGSITLHRRYIYRGYLQIAACDLTRAASPALWYILWDPTQRIATRPLAIQKDGTWYTYGWDLTKNICEVYGSSGYIRATYTYSPYGAVTADGDVEQPIQWSSEVYDECLNLTYYNYRYYDANSGKWLSYDPATSNYNLYKYANNPIHQVDYLGLFLSSQNQPDYESIAIKTNPSKCCKACNNKIQEYKSQMINIFGDELELGVCSYNLICTTKEERDKKHPNFRDREKSHVPAWTKKIKDIQEKKILWWIVRPKKVQVDIHVTCYPEIGEEFLVHETQHAVDYCSIAYTPEIMEKYYMCLEIRAYSKANVNRNQATEDEYKNALYDRVFESFDSIMLGALGHRVDKEEYRAMFNKLYASGNCTKEHY